MNAFPFVVRATVKCRDGRTESTLYRHSEGLTLLNACAAAQLRSECPHLVKSVLFDPVCKLTFPMTEPQYRQYYDLPVLDLSAEDISDQSQEG